MVGIWEDENELSVAPSQMRFCAQISKKLRNHPSRHPQKLRNWSDFCQFCGQNLTILKIILLIINKLKNF